MTPSERCETKLEACPFCGKDTATQFAPTHPVECWSCNAQGPREEYGNHRKAWNTRPAPPAAAGVTDTIDGVGVIDALLACADESAPRWPTYAATLRALAARLGGK